MASDFHESILWQKKGKPLIFLGKCWKAKKKQPCKCATTHEGPAKMCWCFVPTGTSGSVPTDIEVIHQSITIQETLPCVSERSWSEGCKTDMTV